MIGLHRRAVAVVAAFGIALVALLFGATSAEAYLGTSVSISVGQSSVGQGGSVPVSGSGFQPNSEVTLTLRPGSAVLGTVTADSAGHFSTSVTVPAGTSAGSYQIVATDQIGDSAIAAVTVTASTTTPGAPFNTGVAVASIGSVGIALLVGGGLLLVFGRKRRGAGQTV
jgi:hypothetical protein